MKCPHPTPINPKGIRIKTANVYRILLKVNKIMVSINIRTIGPENFNEFPVSACDLI